MEQDFMGYIHVDSVKSSNNYFAHLCIIEGETTLHQKRMSITDRSHLRRQTVETNCKNEPSFSNCVAVLALDLDLDTPAS
jgi:hypothetical protein